VVVQVSVKRQDVRFVSDDAECAAWHYPGTNGGCVVMAGGLAVTKEPATDQFAKRFHDAGFTVLAFDYRRLGQSGGEPRLVLPIEDQLADWQAAITFAASLPGVDADKVAIWGFSASGGFVLDVAARNPQLAAAIAQTPHADGPAGLRNAASFQKPLAMLRFTGRGVLDALGGLLGRPPLLVPLVGPPGTVAMLSTPDAVSDGIRALSPDDRYPDWQQKVAARSALRLGFYAPGRRASRIECPLLVLVCDQDTTAMPAPAVRAANRAPRGELVRMPGAHYEPFLGGHEQAVGAELSFLGRHLLHAHAESAAAMSGKASGKASDARPRPRAGRR
jgi:dienelactone hydrolase